MSDYFDLAPQLAADCIVLGDLALCRVLLMNDARYPWLILVPRRADITELYQLSAVEQAQLMVESSQVGTALMTIFSGDKLNIAALGNVVPQLHIHHVVRYKADETWPAPVWGKGKAIAYLPEELVAVREVLATIFRT